MRVNKQIRAEKVLVIDQDGRQVGVISVREALIMAEQVGLDLVEVSPNANPPVCKIINHGKLRYDQQKKEKEGRKAQHQIKVKEIKLKPNIDDHDFEIKARQARGFIEKGNKVKVTCTFRGREMAHPEIGEELVKRMCTGLDEVAMVESSAKQLGRILTLVLQPRPKKK